jgi:tetratricopeptide (TPR) repeat protein
VKKNTQLCIKCGSANLIGETNCLKCGTKLMIVTFPASYKHDEPFQPTYYEQFLLEKITFLEMQISQMADAFKKIIAIFEKSQEIFNTDHKSVEKIINIFEKITSEQKSLVINEITVFEKEKSEVFFDRIIAEHNGEKTELFNQLIKDGFKFYSQNEEKQALRAFERAVEISAENVSLLIFLGKILFEQENNVLAEKYLKKAREIAPDNKKVLLFLATIYTESERFDNAKNCLNILANKAESDFCFNFINGFVLYAKEDRLDSLKAFQECMSISPSAETAYLFGCILYQVGQDNLAKKVLEMAVKFDENFADAWYMLSRTCLSLNEKNDSEIYLKKVSEAKDSRSQCFEFLNGKKEIPKVALPFIETRFFLKGSKRLSELFKRELEKVLNN